MMRGYGAGYGAGTRGGGRLPSLPAGFAYLTDSDGTVLTDQDGSYLTVEI